MYKYLLIAALAAAPAAPAFAQSDVGPNGASDAATAYGQSDGVSGLRVEPRIGYDRVITELNVEAGENSGRLSEGKSGVTYGGEVGYDMVVNGGTMLGVYGGIEGSSAKQCFDGGDGVDTCLKPGRNLTAGVRGGFLINPTTVAYIKGGYSNGQIRLNYTDPTFPEDNFRLSDNLSGFHVGAGVQAGFGRNFYGKLEYVYTDYNGYEVVDGSDKASLDFSRHQVVAGIGFRF
ncbi:outer membrane beta-barrel protein [Sphingomonas sp. PP-CE-1G-424]|uniref:outer membrane protein n=1 Tax=Sphingomonas sp. PP-CE-1G-424 TaxID=2135658 RepID=UPI0010560368|nr:outer membrane beta-barrel protein [Sphingomonas sp. PP-CE-1G-424]TCP71361.1 outer membrane immunogenic protein [Sphingomonas sp. PP-CE-1G-424]